MPVLDLTRLWALLMEGPEAIRRLLRRPRRFWLACRLINHAAQELGIAPRWQPKARELFLE